MTHADLTASLSTYTVDAVSPIYHDEGHETAREIGHQNRASHQCNFSIDTQETKVGPSGDSRCDFKTKC